MSSVNLGQIPNSDKTSKAHSKLPEKILTNLINISNSNNTTCQDNVDLMLAGKGLLSGKRVRYELEQWRSECGDLNERIRRSPVCICT